MKNYLTILFLFLASQSFAQTLAGTYYVNNNPKNIVKIVIDDRHQRFAVVADNWEGVIKGFDKTKAAFTCHWRYSMKTKDSNLRGLTGDHLAVIQPNGIINVQIFPDDDRMKAGAVKWYPAKR